jgi:hypothetical protein
MSNQRLQAYLQQRPDLSHIPTDSERIEEGSRINFLLKAEKVILFGVIDP